VEQRLSMWGGPTHTMNAEESAPAILPPGAELRPYDFFALPYPVQRGMILEAAAKVLSRHRGRAATLRTRDVARAMGIRRPTSSLRSLIIHVLGSETVAVNGSRWLVTVERLDGGRCTRFRAFRL